MDGTTSIEELTPDQVECELVRWRPGGSDAGTQARLVERAAELRVPQMDGARSIVDWISARLDVARETGLDLARVARSDDVDQSHWR